MEDLEKVPSEIVVKYRLLIEPILEPRIIAGTDLARPKRIDLLQEEENPRPQLRKSIHKVKARPELFLPLLVDHSK